ncbi:Methyltransferase domain-containing protein [Nitrosomonas eutropha]|uniref:glycoside hydrolase family 99-like domain-containing protein n=1 Tax=Nitrosomonas eutropha TaxID=916 RepID=UPI0008907521|nr:glycoside hydrolase family 99-like domain-containing protein [Nitrosomonas eutropha]SCX19581.1 Methyltransferase domain-containing protein [Nitrosomonas eutropha]
MNSYLTDTDYILDVTTNVWSRRDYTGIAYSDGDEVEQRIASIINEVSDLDVLSTELRQHCTDWPSLYHLSGTRANILRPFENDLHGDILEIGAGCGAITRYLGECGGNVLALEGSPRRAAIARARTRDLQNVTVVSDRFDLFSADRKFDAITLIGVLEYANLFTPGEKPALNMLGRVRALLKPEGKLFIAIENQLGLKYFAGAPEDHLGQPMYGIEGRYRNDQPQTFGRIILAEMLKEAGFSACNFLAPFPDYKLPVSIVTEYGFKAKNFDATVFAWQSVRRDPQLPVHLGFSLELVWPAIFDNQLPIDLANSFLIVASPENKDLQDREVFAYHYSTERVPEFCKETTFCIDRETGKITVKYKRMDGVERNEVNHSYIINFICPKSDIYRIGHPLTYEFVQLMTKDDWDIVDVKKYLKKYLEILGELAHEQGVLINLESPYSMLPGNFFDVVPNNLILRENNRVSLIDMEWELTSSIELGHLVFRTLLQLIGLVSHFGSTPTKGMTRGQFVSCVLESLGLSLLPTDYDRYLNIEEQITERVTGCPAKEAVRWWPDYPLRTLRVHEIIAERDKQVTSLNQAIAERDKQVTSLNQAIAERDRKIVSLHHQFYEILNSKSWKLTRPLRHLRRVLTGQNTMTWRSQISIVAHDAWRALPLSIQGKQRLKSILFRAVPFLFRHTNVYENWRNSRYSMNLVTQDRLEIVKETNIKSLGEDIQRVPFDNTQDTYVEYKKNRPIRPTVKLISFYLPQFHPFAENDKWWGKGFTEWFNVGKALPNYKGHYQPHCPIHLGYYDLRIPQIMREQIYLAKEYGIYGFNYYFYWFAGKVLMEAPLEMMLQDKSIDMPFCFTWANENWTRRWDGQENDILIAQNHSPEDSLKFIQYLIRYFEDERYIRIDDKPVLMIYRANIIPNITETAKLWRTEVKKYGIDDLYLISAQAFGIRSPDEFGFDASAEFPPHTAHSTDIRSQVSLLNSQFQGHIFSYDQVVENAIRQTEPDYKLFRTVMLSWDNTARKQNSSHIFHGFSLLRYKQWLNALCHCVNNNQKYTQNEKIVFVNAWNEWAEGTHLEPDRKYGYGYLQATYNVLREFDTTCKNGEAFTSDSRQKVVLVTHDAHPYGAQMLAENLAKILSQSMGFHVDMVCLGEGPLIAEYAKWATVHMLSGKDARGVEAKALASRLYDMGHRNALVNTTASGLFLQTLVEQGIECVALIHELRGVIEQYQLYEHAQVISTHACKIVFPAAEVAESFSDFATIPSSKLVIRPQGLYKRYSGLYGRELSRARLRQKLDLPKDAQIVLGVGAADHRKGVDLFVTAGIGMVSRLPKAYWIWIGPWEHTMQCAIEKQLAAVPELSNRFVFPGLQQDTDLFYGGADVFALTSREDPFPSVVLEAMDAGLPVVGFENAGGFNELLREGGGLLVKKENEAAFGEAVAIFLEQPEVAFAAGARGAELITERFSFRHYVFDLLDLMGIGFDRVSVVVPNYNYAHYLPERLNSILRQDYPIFEILFLDDHSTDESLKIADEILSAQFIDYRIVSNIENSGSVFRQWKKGVDLARGTHIWIAEADDTCSENFLNEVRKGFYTPGVVMSYCESQQIDEQGHLLANNYLAYVSDIDAQRWLSPFVMEGNKAAHSFCIKNVIPNVSAVLFKADSLRAILDQYIEHILSYRVAGDWMVYVLLLKQGSIAFTPIPANSHRRHQNSVTLSSFNVAQLQEICSMQAFVANEFSIPAEQTVAARNYVEKLVEQFGIGSIV